jgi:hypothetical protein
VQVSIAVDVNQINEAIMSRTYLERLNKIEGAKSTLPVLTKADRSVTVGNTARFLVQVCRGRTIEVIDLLCNASGFAELCRVVKSLKLGAILNWEPCVVPS